VRPEHQPPPLANCGGRADVLCHFSALCAGIPVHALDRQGLLQQLPAQFLKLVAVVGVAQAVEMLVQTVFMVA